MGKEVEVEIEVCESVQRVFIERDAWLSAVSNCVVRWRRSAHPKRE